MLHAGPHHLATVDPPAVSIRFPAHGVQAAGRVAPETAASACHRIANRTRAPSRSRDAPRSRPARRPAPVRAWLRPAGPRVRPRPQGRGAATPHRRLRPGRATVRRSQRTHRRDNRPSQSTSGSSRRSSAAREPRRRRKRPATTHARRRCAGYRATSHASARRPAAAEARCCRSGDRDEAWGRPDSSIQEV